jgi:hypothetical protein
MVRRGETVFDAMFVANAIEHRRPRLLEMKDRRGVSRPATKCAFCGNTGATKSHVWPEWAEKILPPSATHHETIIGSFATFTPKVRGPALSKKIRPGHIGSRRPRNTCGECNRGWMRRVEEAVMSIMPNLLLGEASILTVFNQRLLAAFLCLVSMRIEASSHKMKVIPVSDRDWLIKNFEPPPDWKMWIARYDGNATEQRYSPMQIISSETETIGVEYCNTQVTTLVIGQLFAHLFSSTVWPSFPGYEGADLAPIWPPRQCDIELSDLPVITEAQVPWLHETIARELTSVGAPHRSGAP